ncbi:hypothetical protein ACTMU2_31485 [Cupriavidus basilensis]
MLSLVAATVPAPTAQYSTLPDPVIRSRMVRRQTSSMVFANGEKVTDRRDPFTDGGHA